MDKTCLIVLGAKYNREEVVALLNKTQGISHWFYTLPYSIFVNTRLSPKQLCEIIENTLGKHTLFVTEVTQNKWGRLNIELWKSFK